MYDEKQPQNVTSAELLSPVRHRLWPRCNINLAVELGYDALGAGQLGW